MRRRVFLLLDKILQEKGMTQKKLSSITEIRAATINEYYNNVWLSIKRKHLEKISDALEINASELITQNVIEIDKTEINI